MHILGSRSALQQFNRYIIQKLNAKAYHNHSPFAQRSFASSSINFGGDDLVDMNRIVLTVLWYRAMAI